MPVVPEAPPRLVLVNMVTGESREAQFNPSEFSEAVGAVYAKQTVPGLSHQRKHFINTEDVAIGFDLFFTAVHGVPAELESIKEDRKFLYSMVHPWRGAQGIDRGGAPRTLFIWPGFIALSCVITKLAFKYTQFNKLAHPVAWTATVALEEARDEFVGMEEIRELGTLRMPKGFT